MCLNKIEIIPISINHLFCNCEDLGKIISKSVDENGQEIFDKDILVVTQKIVSKVEGRTIFLKSIEPSAKALLISKLQSKDPRLVEVILRESKKIVKISRNVIIVETHHGFICANAGVDQSNTEEETVVLLPKDPDKSALKIKEYFRSQNKEIGVIISDTFGRPFREGQTDIAVGIAGVNPIKSYIGSRDMYGKLLKSTIISVCDEIASAAELVMGKAEKIPVAIIRGYDCDMSENFSISTNLRNEQNDLFR